MSKSETKYSRLLEYSAYSSNPEEYKRGQGEGREIINEHKGAIGQVLDTDLELLGRHIAIQREMYAGSTPYADRHRSFVYGIMSVLEGHLVYMSEDINFINREEAA